MWLELWETEPASAGAGKPPSQGWSVRSGMESVSWQLPSNTAAIIHVQVDRLKPMRSNVAQPG